MTRRPGIDTGRGTISPASSGKRQAKLCRNAVSRLARPRHATTATSRGCRDLPGVVEVSGLRAQPPVQFVPETLQHEPAPWLVPDRAVVFPGTTVRLVGEGIVGSANALSDHPCAAGMQNPSSPRDRDGRRGSFGCRQPAIRRAR